MKKLATPRQIKKFDNSKVVHDGIVNTLLGAGGRNDKRIYSQWQAKTYSVAELTTIYRTNWVARAVIDTIAEDMTGVWRSVYFGNDTDSIARFEAEEKKLKIKKLVTNAIKESRLYGTSFILIGSNSATLANPRLETEDVDYFMILNSGQVVKSGEDIESDYFSNGFGYPKFYQVTLKNQTANSQITIHNSRLIRIDSTYTPSELQKNSNNLVDSVLMSVMDAIERFEMTVSSAGQLLSESSISILKSKRLAELLTQSNGKEKAASYFWESMAGKSVFKTTIIDADDEMIRLNAQLTGVFELIKSNMMEVSGATGIPLTRLFGETQTGLQTGNDSSNKIYYDMVNRRREDMLQPILDVIDPIIVARIGNPAGFNSEFNSLYSQSNAVKAVILKDRTTALVALIQQGAILPSYALKDLVQEGLLDVSDDDIAVIAEMDLNYDKIQNRAQTGEFPPQSSTSVQS